MRIRAAYLALPVLALALVAGCASTSSSTSTTGTSSAATDASGSEASAPPTLGPAVPPATAVAPAVPTNQMPTASGKFGSKPALTFPSSPPPPSLQRMILSAGTGATVTEGSYLQVNYLGQIWGGKVFDNSYDKKTPLTFPLTSGQGGVVPGWVVGLTGTKVGSRVMLSLPPADGYGSAGSSGAGIKGTDTIVFVVDIIKQYAKDAGGQTDATPQKLPSGLPTVTGEPGKAPTLTIPKGTKEPTKNATYVVDKGTGPAVKEGNVLAQVVLSSWDGTQKSSTWPTKAGSADTTPTGPTSITASSQGVTGGLIGVPVGSRVLVLVAASSDATSGQSQPATAVVVDIIAQI